MCVAYVQIFLHISVHAVTINHQTMMQFPSGEACYLGTLSEFPGRGSCEQKREFVHMMHLSFTTCVGLSVSVCVCAQSLYVCASVAMAADSGGV